MGLSRGYRLLERNFRLGRLEGDLLFAEPVAGRCLLWEVRGRTRPGFAPANTLSAKKTGRLKLLAAHVARKYRAKVRLQLVEITGTPPAVRVRVLDIDG